MKNWFRANWKVLTVGMLALGAIGLPIYVYLPEYRGLLFLFFYIIPSNSFIPFPHEPAIIYYGKLYGADLTTLTAAIPTLIACYLDYKILTPVFTHTRLRNIKQTRIYQKTIYYFYKAPFLTNAVAALSPVPFYPVRILSISSGYPMWKYNLAVVLGRLPRYYFLAATGALLNIPNWMIGIFFLSLVSASLYKKLAGKNRQEESVSYPAWVEETVEIK